MVVLLLSIILVPRNLVGCFVPPPHYLITLAVDLARLKIKLAEDLVSGVGGHSVGQTTLVVPWCALTADPPVMHC